MAKDNRRVFPMEKAKEWNITRPNKVDADNPPAIETTKGTDRGNATIEVEKDEVILTPDLKLFKVKGDTHANGGVPYFAQGGEFIFSNNVSLVGKAIKDYFTNMKFSTFNPQLQSKLRANLKPEEELDLSGLSLKDDKEYSMADVARKFSTNQDLENLGEEMSQSKLVNKTTASLNLGNAIKQLSILSNLQETMKGTPVDFMARSGGYYVMQPGKDYFEEGGEYEVDDDQINELRRQGYDFDIL